MNLDEPCLLCCQCTVHACSLCRLFYNCKHFTALEVSLTRTQSRNIFKQACICWSWIMQINKLQQTIYRVTSCLGIISTMLIYSPTKCKGKCYMVTAKFMNISVYWTQTTLNSWNFLNTPMFTFLSSQRHCRGVGVVWWNVAPVLKRWCSL